jgi:hypothetical protein
MTPEENWKRIDNALRYISEMQAKHEDNFAKIEAMHARHEAMQAKHDENFARHEAAIRDLIIVSRTLVDSHKELAENQKKHEVLLDALMQSQMETERKWKEWIDRQSS